MTCPIIEEKFKGGILLKAPNTKVMELKFKIYQWLYEQEHGMAVQRTMNINKNYNSGEGNKGSGNKSDAMENIDEKLAALRQQTDNPALPPGREMPPLPIEVVSEKVEVYAKKDEPKGD